MSSHVEPLDKLSSFFAAGMVVHKSFNALFALFLRVGVVIRKQRFFSWTTVQWIYSQKIAKCIERSKDRLCNQQHNHANTLTKHLGNL